MVQMEPKEEQTDDRISPKSYPTQFKQPAEPANLSHKKANMHLNLFDIHETIDEEDNNNSNRPPYADLVKQVNLLRDLVAIERQNNEQRRRNNILLQKCLQQLQIDYLRQQQELVQALELGVRMKEQKEAQIKVVEATLVEKDRLIEQLRLTLGSLDEDKLRSEFKEALAQQQKLAELEQQQLRDQLHSIEQQLVRERVNNSQVLLQFQAKIEDQSKLHESELERHQTKLKQTQAQLDETLAEPHNQVIKSLREKNSQLNGHIDELTATIDESHQKYANLNGRLEALLLEQQHEEQRNQEELSELQGQLQEYKQQVIELNCALGDKDETIQVLQFNLQRSEKRVKGLMNTLKSKENSYRDMMQQTEVKYEQDLMRLTSRLNYVERQIIERESELESKQNEFIRLQLLHDNQIESIRNDRDERIGKLSSEKEHLEKAIQLLEMKLARKLQLIDSKQRLVGELQHDVERFKDEDKRMKVELTQCEAKLHAKQRELDLWSEKQVKQEKNWQQKSAKLSQSLSFEVAEAKKHAERLEANCEGLKRENDKLRVKLGIAESSLSKLSSSIRQEHLRMVQEYEKRLEQVKSEQTAFDTNRLRYKKYGYKLKKYCEHLKRVHEHLCNPMVCGYIHSSSRSTTGQSEKESIL